MTKYCLRICLWCEREGRLQTKKIFQHQVWVLLDLVYIGYCGLLPSFSYIGAAMYDVGASWLMTSLAPNPLFVSLITTATTLPIFLFALPSGTLSDIFDRRSILLIACVYMFTISTILGILTLVGVTTPTVLLMLTFASRSRNDYD